MAQYARINPKNQTILEVVSFSELRRRYAKHAALSQQLPTFYIESVSSVAARKLRKAEAAAEGKPLKEPRQDFDVWAKVIDEAPETDEAHVAVPGSVQFVDGVYRRMYRIEKRSQKELNRMDDERKERKRQLKLNQLMTPETIYSLIGLVQAVVESPAVRDQVKMPDNLLKFTRSDDEPV